MAAEAIGWREAGESSPDELMLCAAHLKRRRAAEDRKWDRRFFGVCVAIGKFFCDAYQEFDAKQYFPRAFADEAEADEKTIEITDPLMMRDVLKGVCIATGGTVNEPTKEHRS